MVKFSFKFNSLGPKATRVAFYVTKTQRKRNAKKKKKKKIMREKEKDGRPPGPILLCVCAEEVPL